MVFNLTDEDSVASQFLFELREVDVQKDRARFRNNVERLGHILAYEISKTLTYDTVNVRTPLASAPFRHLTEQPVLITILRAGLPFLQGFLAVFDQADTGFIGAYREENVGSIEIKMDYTAIPPVDGRVVILVDPMLATGTSAVRAIKHLLSIGSVRCVHIASVISSPEGVRHVQEFANSISKPVRLWTCAIDERLDENYYIVPGLGDAGDLSYGPK